MELRNEQAQKLLAAGAVPFGLTAIDLARTEVGLIIIAVDYDPGKRSPWDLSMGRFIKTDTGCVGATALRERGEDPPKRFKTLQIEGDAASLLERRCRLARLSEPGEQLGHRLGRFASEPVLAAATLLLVFVLALDAGCGGAGCHGEGRF